MPTGQEQNKVELSRIAKRLLDIDTALKGITRKEYLSGIILQHVSNEAYTALGIARQATIEPRPLDVSVPKQKRKPRDDQKFKSEIDVDALLSRINPDIPLSEDKPSQDLILYWLSKGVKKGKMALLLKRTISTINNWLVLYREGR